MCSGSSESEYNGDILSVNTATQRLFSPHALSFPWHHHRNLPVLREGGKVARAALHDDVREVRYYSGVVTVAPVRDADR